MNLKKALISIFFLCSSMFAEATDGDKNEKLYGITQISYINNYEVSEGIEDPNNVYILTNLDATGSFGIGVFYNMGYFIIPKRLSLGIGAGFVFFDNPKYNTLPIYGDLRFYFTDERDIPYLLLDYGGSILIGDSFKQGHFLDLVLDIKHASVINYVL